MKKRLTALAVAVILLCLGTAVALGGTAGDPMVTRSYLENTFLAGLGDLLQKRANAGTKSTYDAAAAKLDQLGEADVKAAQAAQAGNSAYTPVELKTGDTLDLDQGASLVIYSGNAKVTAGTLADVTRGESVTVGESLETSHRYIATAAHKASVQVTRGGQFGAVGVVTTRKASGVVLPFTDVKSTDWYYNSVSFVYEKGYFAGTSDTTFEPLTSMTRGMLATVLQRFSGDTGKKTENPFTDVPESAWYAPGVTWASENKIVTGMGNNTYQPDGQITREQMVVMLYRYQKDFLKNAAPMAGDLSAFQDEASVSSWARDAVKWAVGVKLLSGRDTGHLDPQGPATRAEVAALMERFAGLLGKG